MRCRVYINGFELEGELLSIKEDRATVLIDGYAASDSVPVEHVIEAWEAPP